MAPIDLQQRHSAFIDSSEYFTIRPDRPRLVESTRSSFQRSKTQMAGKNCFTNAMIVLFTFFTGTICARGADSDSEKLACESVDDACRLHDAFRKSFDNFKCDLHITKGNARDLKTALEAKADAIEVKATADVHWLVDGPREYFELRPDPTNCREPGRSARGEAIEIVHFSPLTLVRDGKFQAVWQGDEIAEIGPGLRRIPADRIPLGVASTGEREASPGSTDVIDLTNRVAQARAEGGKVELIRPRADDSEVEIATTVPGKWRGQGTALTKIAFDTRRGFVPVRFEEGELGREPASRFFVTETIACNGNRWFPKRTVEIEGRIGDTQAVRLQEILVTELTTDRAADDKQAVMMLPKRTILLESTPRKAHFQLREPVSITPQDIGQFVKTTAAQFDAVANLGDEEIVGDEAEEEADTAEGTVESATEPGVRRILIKNVTKDERRDR